MTLIKYRPRTTSLLNNVDLMINSIFNDNFEQIDRSYDSWKPLADIKENDTHYSITADIPGFTKKDIEITINSSVLTITGEKNNEGRDEIEKFYHRERNIGRFFRSFSLPDTVDEDRVDAEFKDGVLTITLHKDEKSIPKEKVVKIK
tara:strand:- start:19 stop:459 length:441 start_codon:yes stop_codon:yes gene_type:complete